MASVGDPPKSGYFDLPQGVDVMPAGPLNTPRYPEWV
jgi:hypothetical protein